MLKSMNGFRIGLLVSLATLTLGAVSVPAAAASSGTTTSSSTTSAPALKTIHVHGLTRTGKKFKGTYAIQRFVAGTHRVYAVGTLKGTLLGRQVTRHNVKMPAKLVKASGSTAQTAKACTVLHLQLGPIDLNLLGLRVQLFGGTNSKQPQPITLLITADPNGGLLGQLLCDITGFLNKSGILSQLSSNLQQLAATLTGITSILGAL